MEESTSSRHCTTYGVCLFENSSASSLSTLGEDQICGTHELTRHECGRSHPCNTAGGLRRYVPQTNTTICRFRTHLGVQELPPRAAAEPVRMRRMSAKSKKILKSHHKDKNENQGIRHLRKNTGECVREQRRTRNMLSAFRQWARRVWLCTAALRFFDAPSFW